MGVRKLKPVTPGQRFRIVNDNTNITASKPEKSLVKGKSKSFKLRAGKRSDWKKAYVRVQEGQVIDFLGGDSV